MPAAGANRRVAKTMAERQAAGPPPDQPTSISLDAQLSLEEDITASGVPQIPPPTTFAPLDLDDSPRVMPITTPAGPLTQVAGGEVPHPAAAARTRPVGHPDLAPYRAWEAWPLTSISQGQPDRVLDDLLEILSIEGPMHALRLYQLHRRLPAAVG